MDDFSQIASQITQMRNFFVNEAVATAQQVQAGTRQVQAQQPVVTSGGQGGSQGLFWFGLGTIAALVVAYYYWRR